MEELRIALVGTTDLHGYVEGHPLVVHDKSGVERTVHSGGLALFGGYMDNLRARMPVLLLDAGDMFQGTMVSNMGEGQAVVEAYHLLKYQAVTIGNHEFDYGPVGPRAVPGLTGSDDPNGALKARAASAQFPFLSANLLDKKTGKPVTWTNVHTSVKVEVAGIPIGIIGALTEDTPQTTNALNLRDVSIGKIVPAVRAEAQALRAAGVAAVILSIHEGANCQAFDNPRDLKPCQNADGHVLPIISALGDVIDAVVAGHTHAGMAHFVGDVPVVQAYSYGHAFGRIDLTFQRPNKLAAWQLSRPRSQIHPPVELCEVELPPVVPGTADSLRHHCDVRGLNGTDLHPSQYEGRPVVPSAAVTAALRPYIERANARAMTPLGMTLKNRVPRNFRNESPLAQLMADLVLSGASRVLGQPVDIAVQNGGGIRNELAAGPLHYRGVFEVQPFDNRLALLRLTGAEIAELFRRNLTSSHGVLVPSGIRVEAHCQGADLKVTVRRTNGEALDPNRTYVLAMSDFLASGGDSFAGLVAAKTRENGTQQSPITYYDDILLRELIVEELMHYKGPLLDGQMQAPRLILPSPRPVRCAASATP